jgi:C1A family cysteine protease
MFKLKSFASVLLVMCVSVFLLGFQQTEDEVQDEIRRITKAIELHGARWTAGETSLSRLTLEERRRRLGYIPPRFEDPDRYVKIDIRAEFQASLDWRVNAGNFMTVVKNQGSCGSCWAFSTIGTMEAVYNIEQGLYEVQPLVLGSENDSPERGMNFPGQEFNFYESKMNHDLRYRELFNRNSVFSSDQKTMPLMAGFGYLFPQFTLHGWVVNNNFTFSRLSWKEKSSPPVSPGGDLKENSSLWIQDTAPSEKRLIRALSFPDFSEQDLVSCSPAGTCGGGSSASAADYIKNTGLVSESCFPYTAQDDPCNLCVDYIDKLSRITDWGWVTQNVADETAIKSALLSGPLAAFMEVYNDFYSYTGGIYEHVSGSYLGGHGIVIVGYYDDGVDKYWICKNSWGTFWGDNGYFNIKMGECEIGTWVLKLWGVTTSNQPPVLADINLSLANKTFKEGSEFTIQLQASDPESGSLTYGASPLPAGANFNTSTGLFTWEPTHTQAGNYSIRFSVSDGILEDSQIVTIRVLQVKKGKGRF